MASLNLFLKYAITLLLIIIVNSSLAQNNRLSLEYNKQQTNITKLLDNLLKGYNNNIRPGYGGEPVIIEVDIMVRSMGPISEIDMTYSMDCYFRQSWIDRRLSFNSNQNTLALSISMLEKIWKPDTYFYNGKYSYLHTITTPNKFVRLYQDGRVLYSSRLTIKAGCSMNLEDFPMDIQRCPLKFGSFGYTITDLIYRWNGARKAVAIANDMKLSQFDLIDCPVDDLTDFITHNFTNYIINKELLTTKSAAQHSILLVNFHLKRHMGNFLIQVYGPCILLVVLSWVSFWLNREATADRVSLGITTVLTMTFLGLEARTDLPKVPYPTALDFFVFLSFAFIFASIIQFAIVHYFTKYGSGEFYFYRDDLNNYNLKSNNLLREQINKDNKIFEIIPLSACKIEQKLVKTKATNELRNKIQILQSTTNQQAFTPIISTLQINSTDIQQQNQLNHIHFKKTATTTSTTHRNIRFNSVSKIDKLSRIFFPLIFFFINLFYWVLYLTKNK